MVFFIHFLSTLSSDGLINSLVIVFQDWDGQTYGGGPSGVGPAIYYYNQYHCTAIFYLIYLIIR
jgi:hypothetical protein